MMQIPGWNTRDQRTRKAAKAFAANLGQPLSLDAGARVQVQATSTPTLRSGSRILNLDFNVTDSFTAKTGLLATIFVRDGDDFVRITTSVRKQDGERAIGTPLDRSQPAYRDALQGKAYIGYAMVFGKQCVTRYDPVRDASGRVIAILFVGMDVSNSPPMALPLSFALRVVFLGAALQVGYFAAQGGTTDGALMAFMGLSTLGFGAAIYYWIHQLVAKPVKLGREAALRLAGGDLTNQVHVSAGDEIGQMLLAINGISVGLAGLVGNVRRSSMQVTDGSREISDGNVDLAGRTEQQAGEVNAAASAMHELTVTVTQTADRANQLNGLVASVSRMAETGGDVVGQVVQTMGQIKTSSHRINDIIGLIDGIAFQTNILALNAAVEAARAGEQGRGFAVVAAEVRSLAQRSSAAAHEIKDLIDASVSTANVGGALVDRARDSMAQIAHAIKEVVTHIDDIALTSNEQRLGIESLNRSVDEIEKMTQQNAALVEQSAAASMRVRDQAEQLSAAVNGFKTPV